MSSFAVHRMQVAASLAVLACACAPATAFSQLEQLSAANGAAQERIFAAIEAAEARSGVRSAELVGPFTELALLYEEAGDHDLALGAINQALHVVRTNFGLYSLEQVPLLRMAGQIEWRRGNATGARDFDRQVFALAKRNPNDLDAVPVLRELANKLGGPLGIQARSEAIRVLLRNEQYASEELRAIESELLSDSFYSVAHMQTTTLVRGPAYEVGRDSLRRVAGYQEKNGEPLLARAETFVAIADWDLLFKEKGSAVEIYEEVYSLLKENGVEQAAIDRIFAPTVPVVLPVFRSNPFAAEPTAGSRGYIEIGFEIGKHGAASSIEVLDTSTVSNADVEHNLVDWVRHNRFRPRVVGAELARSAPVVARYYVMPYCSSAPVGQR